MEIQKKQQALQNRLQRLNQRILDACNQYYLERQDIENEWQELQKEAQEEARGEEVKGLKAEEKLKEKKEK